jgi:uncharacterized membrane protein YeaQ/YmgE (transglycosylase-associated protein family)
MLFLLSWLIFGLLVGYIAKLLHPGDEPVGYVPTLGIGVVGSFVGGAINYLIGSGSSPFEASGLLMSILGGVICCAGWRYYKLKTDKNGPKGFISGKKLD